MTEDMKGLVAKAASALKAVGAKEVYVFGSASKGKMRPNSDVDMAVCHAVGESTGDSG